MATERQAPDAILASSNLTGTVGDVQDDPDSPDSNWLTADDDGTDTDVRFSFPTPSADPNTGAGLQEFRLWVRVGTEAGGNTPTLDIHLWENGSLVSTLATGISITNYTGEIVSQTWDATLLGTADGSVVELRLVGQRSGGAPGGRRTVEFGAVEWNVDYTPAAAGTPYYYNRLLGYEAA